MKLFKIFAVAVLLITIISGCGAQPAVPTMSAQDVQSTAISAASTMVAQTQAAIPTVPPTATFTFTPVFTDTPVASPTSAISPTPVPPTTNPNVDPCDTRVLSAPRGQETIIRIVNTTRQPISVSIYLNETASHGECGYRTYNLARNNDVVINDLVQGCYNLWAWSTDNSHPFNSSGYGCINNPDKWTFEVAEGSIKFVGP